MSRRGGFTAPEALVALLLGLFVVHLGFSTLERVRAVQGRLTARTDALVAMRVARHALRRELGFGRAGVDWRADGDSLSLRAFRGVALICPGGGSTDRITVRFTGDRSPDPAKDSLLVVLPEGREEIRRLVAVGSASSGCAAVPESKLETWQLDAPVSGAAVVARLFERGSYHLAASALRYRRGFSGRQPLTPDVWSPATAWTRSGARVGLSAEPRDSAMGPTWSAFLAWSP
jgi:hypothetical protein